VKKLKEIVKLKKGKGNRESIKRCNVLILSIMDRKY
jgi:hypothetical protein